MGGLTTPRALLSLALPTSARKPAPTGAHPDSTLAIGLPPGTRKRCPACTGDTRGQPCPNQGQAVITAWLTENPVLDARHLEPTPRLRRVFKVENASLCPDRPVITLEARDQPVPYPALRSLDSGEITLCRHPAPGDTLVLYPACPPAETARFDGFDSPDHHPWLTTHPQGRAVITDAGGMERDVSSSIFYLWGARLDDRDTTFDALHFGVLEQRALSPLLRPGSNDWMLLTFAQPDATFADSDDTVTSSRFADSDDLDGTRFALLDGTIGRVMPATPRYCSSPSIRPTPGAPPRATPPTWAA
jgi:hypothetical protein